ncbi:MAG: carboxypeptidase regulatory-like domain-containing protein [Acidobacteriota bacterium]
MKKLLQLALAISIGLFTVIASSAQVTGGAVTGSISDTNGAVIPNATVKLTDNVRGLVFTATTSGSGSYLFPNISVGAYTVSIDANGFGRTTRQIVVSLNQTITVDATLQAGNSTNVVDVTGSNEAIVQTDTSQIGKNFDTRSVSDLPINGNANNLAVLSASVIPSADGTANDSPVIGGIRNRGNSFNVDGVDNNDPGVTGAVTGPIQDAVSEFTLLQNNFNAEFGAGAGGQFNTITKSGTNSYHGSLFSYIGSQKLNAPSTDESAQGFKNFFKEVRYGGTFGGPLPFLNFGEGGPMFTSGKNKLFFFGAYEKYYQAGASAAGSFFAPTLVGLNQLAAIPGVSPFVIDIFRTKVSLAPVADADATAAFGNILGRTGIPFGEVILPIPASKQQQSYQFNVDHLPNVKNQFRYRYSRTRYLSEDAGDGGLSFNNLSLFNTDAFSINYIRTFSSNIINDLRLSYLGTLTDSPLKDKSLSNFPNIAVDSLNLAIGPNGVLPQSGYEFNYQAYDSLTVVTGQHTLKFGVDYRRYIGGNKFLSRERGDYDYSTFDILLQDLAPDNVNIRGVGSGGFVGNNQRVFAFGQDDWKVRPSFTLNLGVRYEYQGEYRDAALQATAANASVPGVIDFRAPRVDKNNFAPRLGFAWSPTWDNFVGRFLFGKPGESSIRGNYSRAFFSNFSNLTSNSAPPTLAGELQFTGSATHFLQNGGALNLPFIPDLSPTFLRANASSYILDQVVPYADSFTISYQREVGRNSGLEIRYLRTQGRQMPVQVQLNARQVPNAAFVVPTYLQAPSAANLASLPTIGTIVAANPTIDPATYLGTRPLDQYGFGGVLTAFPAIGESNYDGLSASFNRRFARNLGFSAAYTLSKTTDNSTNELNTSVLNPRRAQDAGNFFSPAGLNIKNELGPSPLDVRNRFVTSFNVDVPFFNNSKNSALRAVFGGFQINGIFQAQSGQPITVLSGRDANRNGDSAGDRALFNAAGDPNVSSGIQGVTLVGGVVTLVPVGAAPNPNVRAYVATNPNAGYISTGFFAKELANQGAGTSGRNAFRTHGFNQTDLVVLKNTRIGRDGRFNFQIGAEIFDLFNQREKTIVGVGSQTASFATAGNVNFNNYQIGSFTGRSVRMRAKFIF